MKHFVGNHDFSTDDRSFTRIRPVTLTSCYLVLILQLIASLVGTVWCVSPVTVARGVKDEVV